MVKEKIVLDNEIDKCKELFDGLCSIMKAYESLPIYEDINLKCGNDLFRTSKLKRSTYFAKAFNDLIIGYVTQPSKELSDEDEW